MKRSTTPELIAYSGFLKYAPLTEQQHESARRVIGAHGGIVDLTPTWLEIEYAGRDVGRSVVEMLRGLAAIISDAEGEVICTIEQDDAVPTFEFYSIKGGGLVRQRGRIVRGPAEIVTTTTAREAVHVHA